MNELPTEIELKQFIRLAKERVLMSQKRLDDLTLVTESAIKRKNKPGAGRPQKYGEPLVRIRVPVGLLDTVKNICKAYAEGKKK